MNTSVKIIFFSIIILFFIISVSTNSWTTKYNKQNILNIETITRENVGIWSECIKSSSTAGNNENINVNNCSNVKSDNSLIFIKIYILFSFVFIILSAFSWLLYNNKLYTIVFLLLAFIFSFLTCIIWNSNQVLKDGTLGYSWYLQLFGSFLTLIFAIIIQFNLI
jgi:hypothetical protein